VENSLEQLKRYTVVVADSGDFGLLSKLKPQDSTTNPSLLLSASSKPEYKHLTEEALAYAKKKAPANVTKQLEIALDRLSVNFGLEILKLIPGRVSTELDARLSFDTEATIRKAREIIAMYKAEGIDTEKRVLIKIASTWEGLQAAKQLEMEGIHVNMTLLFSIAQAAVAAENGVTLISPFVGRITDFHKEKKKVSGFPPAEDPGVISVQNIYNYYKKFGYKTVVMGASFRTADQVLELSGCDLLTISPQLLEEIMKRNTPIPRRLDPQSAKLKSKIDKPLIYDQKKFLTEMNDDDMAYFKLGEGVRKFAEDLIKLEDALRKQLQAKL